MRELINMIVNVIYLNPQKRMRIRIEKKRKEQILYLINRLFSIPNMLIFIEDSLQKYFRNPNILKLD